MGRREQPGDISCHDAPKTSHGQIGGRARGLGRLGGAAAAPLQPRAQSDRGRATGSIQRLVFFLNIIIMLCYVAIAR